MSGDNLVTGAGNPEVPPNADGTLGGGSVTQGVTPPSSTVDVEKLVQERTSKLEKDINNIKSTFQRKEFELSNQLKEYQEKYEKYIRETKMKGMDEVERKAFEENELLERARTLEAQNAAARQALIERDQRDQYRSFFESVGLNMKDLDSSGDLAAFVNSGYAAWAKKTKELEQEVQKLKTSTPSKDDEITPPPVDTGNTNPPKKPTWKDLIAKYGSMETVYRKVEKGDLPSSILPEV